MIQVVFPEGKDCASWFLFDASTNELAAVLHTCGGAAPASCGSSAACIPERCLPSTTATYSTPASCPVIPDAGASDASP